jgi:hypothetical protein
MEGGAGRVRTRWRRGTWVGTLGVQGDLEGGLNCLPDGVALDHRVLTGASSMSVPTCLPNFQT